MDIERTLLSHILGFPSYINSKGHDNNYHYNENLKDDLEPPSSIYRQLYETSNKYLENGYSVLYTAESLPNERDKAKVVEDISNVNNNNNNNKQVQDVRNDVERGLLRVIDADIIYKDNASGKDIVDFFISNVYEMHRKLQEKTKGTVIFNMPDPYFSRGKYDAFMAFEEEINKGLPENVGLLCWYKRRWLNNLSFVRTINVLANHRYTVHADWKYKEWNASKIIDIISKGIDNNLGEGASVLLFQTMKSAYKLNQNSIVYSPTRFEETLKKLLGEEDATSVIHSILSEIIKEVEFTYT